MQKLLLALVALAGTAMFFMNAGELSHNLRANNSVEIYKIYTAWKSQNNFNTNGEEDLYRFSVFQENFLFAENFNAEQSGSLRLGMTPYAAMTTEEFAKQMTSDLTSSRSNTVETRRATMGDVPKSVNWVEEGAVAPVEDQGHCGSCWAFSTKEGLEGIYAIKTGNIEVLSAQQLVDCSLANFGCSGGDPMNAYKYVSKNGIQSEESYPYVSGETGHRSEEGCQYDSSKVVFTPTSQVKVSPTNNVNAIQEAAANQPLTIEVSAGNIFFQLYNSGVIDNENCPTDLDHGVLLTGYDNSAETPYWTIKNSWGPSWGNKGYANLAITGDGKGICGIQQYAAYPVWNE